MKVLPKLLLELCNDALAVMLFPFVFKAIAGQTKKDFADYTLPQLKPVLDSVEGDALGVVLKHSEDMVKVLSRYGPLTWCSVIVQEGERMHSHGHWKFVFEGGHIFCSKECNANYIENVNHHISFLWSLGWVMLLCRMLKSVRILSI